jgi:hypothetical protein
MTTRCARVSSRHSSELLAKHHFRTQAEGQMAVFRFIEGVDRRTGERVVIYEAGR